jgi:hypothetical protein
VNRLRLLGKRPRDLLVYLGSAWKLPNVRLQLVLLPVSESIPESRIDNTPTYVSESISTNQTLAFQAISTHQPPHVDHCSAVTQGSLSTTAMAFLRPYRIATEATSRSTGEMETVRTCYSRSRHYIGLPTPAECCGRIFPIIQQARGVFHSCDLPIL